MRKIFSVVLICLMGVMVGLVSAEEKIPIPEFYGAYFVSDGNLIPVEKEAKEEGRLKMVGDAFDTVFGISELSGVSLASDFYFLVYGQNEMTVMRRLKLGKFKFVEQVRLGTLEKSWRQANMWIVEKDIAMNSGPIKGVSDLYRFVPVSPLSNGVYALYMFPPTGFDSIGMPCVIVDFVVGKIPETQLMPAKIPSPKPSETPEKITIDSLTKNIPDADYFVGQSKIFDASFDTVWNAANEYLKKDDVIDISDPNKGILTTKQMTNFLRDFKYQTFVLIEKISEDSTKVTVKRFSYKYAQYQPPYQHLNGWNKERTSGSETALAGIEKEIKKEVKQQGKQGYSVGADGKQYYSVAVDGKEYKISGDIFTVKKEGRVFKDEKGAVVRDLDLAKKIAQTAWVYENVVKAGGIPASQRVSAILDAHKALRRYELAQDILARASVQILAATISGGATLTYAVPAGLTWRVVRDQFVNLKGLLSLTGRQGLEEALSKYQQMEALIANLKPNHIDEATAAEIKGLYESAYGLDLPYSALLTSLMPKHGRELVDKALKDVGDELVKTLPLSDEVLTTSEVLDLQGKMEDALKAAPALKEYYEKLNLAKRLKEANEQTITAWAEQAVQYKE